VGSQLFAGKDAGNQTLAPYRHHWFVEETRTNTLENERRCPKVPPNRCGYHDEMTDVTILIEATVGRWHHTATKSMRIPSQDDRHHPILVEAYGKRSYGDD
jgi:hypothetical protein